MLAALVIAIAVLPISVNSWDHKDTYTQSGSNQTNFAPANSGPSHASAKSPASGNTYAGFWQGNESLNEVFSAWAQNGATACQHGNLSTTVSATVFKSVCMVNGTGVGIATGWDNSSPYAQQAGLCPNKPPQ